MTNHTEEVIDFGGGSTEPDIVEEQVQGDTADELQIKYYGVDLPSKGKLNYPETLRYRDILVRDEKILSTSTAGTYKRVLGETLQSLLEDKTVYNRLTTYDRDFLLLWIWANNYNPEKEFGIVCQHCESKEEVKVNLTELEFSDIDPEYEPDFPLELSNGELVKLNMITLANEKVVEKFIKENPKADINTALMVSSITFKKVMSLKDKLNYLDSNNIKGKDMAMVRAFHEHFKYGLNERENHMCTVCGEVTQYEVPFSVEFFLPTLRADFKSLLSARKRAKGSAE